MKTITLEQHDAVVIALARAHARIVRNLKDEIAKRVTREELIEATTKARDRARKPNCLECSFPNCDCHYTHGARGTTSTDD